MDESDPHSAGVLGLGLVQPACRQESEESSGDPGRSGERKSRAGHQRTKDRRFLLELHGHVGHRRGGNQNHPNPTPPNSRNPDPRPPPTPATPLAPPTPPAPSSLYLP